MITAVQFEAFLAILKQPSTIKGILGLLALLGVGFKPENWEPMVAGVSAVYFAIAIFWQKS